MWGGRGSSIFAGDSKDPDGPVLVFAVSEWQEFLTGIRDGDFDELVDVATKSAEVASTTSH